MQSTDSDTPSHSEQADWANYVMRQRAAGNVGHN
jgi:hypothetical protein